MRSSEVSLYIIKRKGVLLHRLSKLNLWRFSTTTEASFSESDSDAELNISNLDDPDNNESSYWSDIALEIDSETHKVTHVK